MSGGDARTIESVEAVAKAKGLVVRYPIPNQLFVDIDNEASRERFFVMLKMLSEKLSVIDHMIWPSPSGEPGHYHASVLLIRDVASEMERCLLQALLGSDPKREMLSWNRIDAEVVTCFFEKPEAQT